MFTRVYLIVICIFSAFISLLGDVSAGVVKSYIPAPRISLTGTTHDVRFDIVPALFGTDFSGAYLDTRTNILSGAFYINNIGWVLFSSGASQVQMTCSVPLKDITPLTPSCQFSGSAWSENIGDIDVANIRYNPSSATLSGSIRSFAGDFSMEGIILPLIPIDTVMPLDTGIRANHSLSLGVKNPQSYGQGTWSGILIPSKNPIFVQSLAGSMGQYTLDLSLADTYTLVLEDPQGSQTHWSGVQVIPDVLTQNADNTPSTFIENFCAITPSEPRCTNRGATTLQKVGTNLLADGQSYYEFTLKPRDRYGNPIDTGKVEISYTGTVSAIQLPSDMLSTLYPFSNMHDALIFSGEMFATSYNGRWENIIPIQLSGQNIVYRIASNAPTDGLENIVVLDAITYTANDGTTSTLRDSVQIPFLQPYSVDITPPPTVIVASENAFAGGFSGFTSASLHPDVLVVLDIGSGILAEFQDIIASVPFTEKSLDSDWLIDGISPSTLLISDIAPGTTFTFTGTYIPRTAYPELENISYQSFVHLQSSDNFGTPTDVLYPVGTPGLTSRAEYRASRVRILGQNNARAEYGTIATNTKTRTEVFNKIRKNVALMGRNRTDFTNAPYSIIENMDTVVDNTTFTTKGTIIVIGHDIKITSNILKNPDKPVALIALADTEGHGGNIIIDSGVTDIYAGLFAEHSIQSTGPNQLYVYGSLISANTLGETVAGICPYYVTGVCDAAKYDLEEIRSYTGTTSGLQSSGTSDYPGTALIIEYDIRLQTDPPPGLSE